MFPNDCIAYEGLFCSFLGYMHCFTYKRLGFANSGLYTIRTAPLLRIPKPAGGAGDTFQGLVETHEDAMTVRALSDFPVSFPSLPKQPRAVPDFPLQLLLIWSK